MKYLKSLTVVILFISFWGCSHDKFVTKFENTLGRENSQTLTELISDFESDFLKRQYPNLNTKSAYGKFLTDLRDEKTDWKKISEESRAKFDNSSLKNEIYRYPDSVWIERDTAKMRIKSPMPVVKRRFKSLNKDGSVEYAISEGSYPGMNPLDIDKFLEQLKTEPKKEYYIPCDTITIIKRLIQHLIYTYDNLGYLDKKEELTELLNILEN